MTQTLPSRETNSLKLRWLLACACVRQELKRKGSFTGFHDVPGVIQRALRRAKERGHLLSGEEVSTYLEKLWDGCIATNVSFGEQLVHEIEFAMARHPSVLLSYLRLAKGCDWKPCERQGLLSLSLAWCDEDMQNCKLRRLPSFLRNQMTCEEC